jgi:hypothetical protein
MNITTSNNTVMTGTTTTSTTGTATCSNLIYTGGNIGNTFTYQPYTTTWTYPNLSMNNREHLKQLRIIKRTLRRNKVYASAGNAHR